MMSRFPLTERWHEYFDSAVVSYLESLQKKGFELILVGGAVRDFILTGAFSNDLDFEIRNKNILDEKWPDYLNEQFLKMGAPFESLLFSIFRVNISGVQLEFASPRLEKYSEKNDFSHEEFFVSLSAQLTFKEAVLRRDFTINGIGLKFLEDGKTEFLDPLNGCFHLKKKELHPCGPDFYKDPVRRLRMIRFKHTLQMTSHNIDTKLFNLAKLSPHYVRYEASKMCFSKFMKSLLQEKLPSWGNKLAFVKELNISKELMTSQDFLQYYILYHGIDTPLDDEKMLSRHVDDFVLFFNIRKKMALEYLLLRKILLKNFSFDSWLRAMEQNRPYPFDNFDKMAKFLDEIIPILKYIKKYPSSAYFKSSEGAKDVLQLKSYFTFKGKFLGMKQEDFNHYLALTADKKNKCKDLFTFKVIFFLKSQGRK